MNPARELRRLYALAFGATALLSVGLGLVANHLIVNCTRSLPLGLYWISRGTGPGRGDLVAVPVPASVRTLVRERRYLPEGALLLKRVVAWPGDRVCTEGGVFSINDAPFGALESHDSAGRSLPQLTFCGMVADGELYLASRAPHSFDSRVFGPVFATDVRGTVTPVWTF